MRIWKANIDLETLKAHYQNTIVSHLGIEFIDVGDNYLTAKMPVDHRTLQPFAIMHGGASCVLAETVASVASTFCIDLSKQVCVGVEINTSHIRQVKSGWVIGIAKPLHLGRTTHLWEIPIENEEGKLVSMSRLRVAIIEKTQD